MPYIPQESRERLDVWLQDRPLAMPPGSLAYVLFRILREEAARPNYMTLALLVGVLETVKMEFNRRVVVPYEKKKCEENGDA